MRKNKIDGYQLTGSIHTVEIKSSDIVIPDDETRPYYNRLYESCDKDGVITSTAVINPNAKEDIFSYRQLLVMLDKITAEAGIENYYVERADMRFDNYDADHYHKFAKLNRYLISLLAITYNVRNTYKTDDLWSSDQLSVCIKSRWLEAESYDKNKESGGTDPAKARLELRTKGGVPDLQQEFMTNWTKRWDKALKNLDAVQQKYNAELLKVYLRDRDATPRRWRSPTDFILQYQDSIYSRKQLIDLLSAMPEIGSDKAESRADNIKRKYRIEYFTPTEVRAAVAEIKRSAAVFFGS